jgi:integral membrane sensor domain MASE1
MTDKSGKWESFKAEGATFADRIKALVHEGNVRRVVVEHDGRTIAEFPLTVGVVGAVLAPVAAAIAGVVALFKDCTIHVERTSSDTNVTESGRASQSTAGSARAV